MWQFYCDVIRPAWSNFRWKNSIRTNVEVEESITSLEDIAKVARKVYSTFEYTYDDVSQLFDSIVPPGQAYTNYKHQNFKDDCDGFHACIYHILQAKGIPVYLLTIITKPFTRSHTINMFYINNKWYILDYYNIYKDGYVYAEDAIDNYLAKNVGDKGYQWKAWTCINLLKYEYGVNGQYVTVNISNLKDIKS